jgi:hypothetical protein
LISSFCDVTSKVYVPPVAPLAAAAPGGKPIPPPKPVKTPSYLPSRSVAIALLESLKPGQPVTTLDGLQQLVIDLPEGSNIRGVLQSALNTANGDIEKARTTLATWCDDAMDRLGGVYKDNARKIGIIVGFLLALLINADTVFVGAQLWSDSSLQASLSASAAGIVARHDPAKQDPSMKALQSDVNDLQILPVGWYAKNLPGFTWHKAPAPKKGQPVDPNADGNPQFWTDVGWDGVLGLLKVIGLLMTGLALSLGAPFWFDTLNKIVNIRAAGPKPAATNKSAPKKGK